MDNILNIDRREDFRKWLKEKASSAKECFIPLLRKKPDGISFVYLDAVEEALCFGWIDSTYKIIDGIHYQRFSKRTNKSSWTELNKERARRMIKLGLMTEAGYQVLPSLYENFIIDEEIKTALIKEGCFEIFQSFSPLYQRIRISNIMSKKKDIKAYEASLNHLIKETKKGKMFGSWNDYGRLLDY